MGSRSLALLCAFALAPPALAQDDGGGWQRVEAVAAQAGDGIVTLGELERFVEERSKQAGIRIDSDEARDKYLHDALGPVLVQELETQAGEDLGLDPARIERAVRLTLDERRRELGPQEYRDFLETEGADAIGIGAKQSDAIHRQAWIGKQLGYENSGTERPVRDRYVRPGELRAIYRTNKDGLGSPVRVRLQDLVFPVEAVGGDVERARALVTSVRERAVGGEDFDQLVDEFGFSNRKELGKTEWLEARRLIDESLRSFALESAVGSYTEVLAILERGETIAFHVIKLLEREDGEQAPGFEDEVMQQFLRREYLRKRDADILARARAALDQKAYVWRAPGWEPPAAGAGAGVAASAAAPAP